MTYYDLNIISNFDDWFNSFNPKPTTEEEKLKLLIINHKDAYIENGILNPKAVKEIAKKRNTYLLCILPEEFDIKRLCPSLDFERIVTVLKVFKHNIILWAEMSGIPINKVHFTNKYDYLDYCYNRDGFITTDKTLADEWSELGGVGIVKEK